MGWMWRLALASLYNRRGVVLLTLCTLAVSVVLLLAIGRLQQAARTSFAQTVSGTDLIVGARGGPVQLLLYTVFHLGDATQDIRYDSYVHFAAAPEVAWAVPIALGDSHRGHRVVGTSAGFFEHYRYGDRQNLRLAEGLAFAGLFEVVLGADVAEKHGYRLGDEVVIAHGGGRVSFVEHADHPFRVVGILARTGTPVDRALYVSLEAIEAIHVGFTGGVRLPGRAPSAEQLAAMDLRPKRITAFLLGLDNRVAVFGLQRRINTWPDEPLLAILPGISLQQLWGVVGVAERALELVAGCVVVAGLFGMLAMLLASLAQRRREMAILRAVGVRPWQISALLVLESGLISLAGIVIGLGLVAMATLALAAPVQERFGILLTPSWPDARGWYLLAAVQGMGMLLGLGPGLKARFDALADGLTPRL